jgi:hypothetical protein
LGKYCAYTAILLYAHSSGMISLLGKEGVGPFFRNIDLSKSTVNIHGGAFVHKDLYPVKCSSMGSNAIVQYDWYSDAKPGVKQNLCETWLGTKLHEACQHSPHEITRSLSGHCFRNQSFSVDMILIMSLLLVTGP